MKRHAIIALTGILLAPSAFAKPLEIVIHHRYGEAPLLMESARYESAAKETFSVTRLAYLLSNFSLEREDGTLVKLDEFAFVEAHQRSSFSLSSAPSGSFRALHFDVGLGTITSNPADRGKFATPSLRNISLTAPHMHDGRFATIEEVVAHYNAGVTRSPNFDPNLAKHPDTGLGLSDADQAALVAFLKTLTDTTRKPSR